MSTLRNSVQLIGHLGADPEIKTLDKGMQMVKLRLATTESYRTDKGDWKEETQWHTITAWDTLAARAAKQLRKGSYLIVQGKLINRSYTDAQSNKKYVTEVRAISYVLLDKQKGNTGEPAAAMQEETSEALGF